MFNIMHSNADRFGDFFWALQLFRSAVKLGCSALPITEFCGRVAFVSIKPSNNHNIITWLNELGGISERVQKKKKKKSAVANGSDDPHGCTILQYNM